MAEKSWTYQMTFPSSADVSDAKRTDLVFKGLDTFAQVTLNGRQILEADNMFLEYRVDVTDFLKAAGGSPSSLNDLQIVFDSALLRGRELVKEHENEHRFISHQAESSRLPVRKAQCHWGWDWGPILITAGPWRPIFLETYTCRIDDVWFQGQVHQDLKSVSGKLFARVDGGKQGVKDGSVVKFSLSLDGSLVFESQADIDGQSLAKLDFRVENPALWYPNGYGKQARYQLKATLVQVGAECASKSRLIGFRRCQLIQERDTFGKSFHFRMNNIDIFAGGSCWIPADSFLPQIGAERYRRWIELMVQGNQVMAR